MARLLVSDILFSKSDSSVSYLLFKTNLLVSILFTFATSLSVTVYLTISLITTLLFTLSTSILSTSAFNLAKCNFSAKLNVSISVAFCQFLLHN